MGENETEQVPTFFNVGGRDERYAEMLYDSMPQKKQALLLRSEQASQDQEIDPKLLRTLLLS